MTKITANDSRWKASTLEPQNLPRMERILSSIERQAKELRSSFEKFKVDPERNAPQLENMAHDASILNSDVRVLLRSLGES